jgi:hypothetical protein
MNVGSVKARLGLKQFALLIDVNPFVTGCGNRGDKTVKKADKSKSFVAV